MKYLHWIMRHSFLWLLPAGLAYWLFKTDTDAGITTAAMLTNLATGVLVVTLAHLARKYVFPYIKLEKHVNAAERSPTGAGLVVLAMAIVFVGLLLVFAPRAHAEDVRTFVPAGALKYAPVLKQEQLRLWPDHPAPEMLGSLVEQESCISLTHRTCWNPAARLKTAREEGASFGQITRAYKADGTLRFDALAATRQLDPSLAEWSWSNVYSRPDLALRAIVATGRDCERRLRPVIADPQARLDFCDAAYNGGYAGMQAERRACGQKVGCDPKKWFGNVALVCLKSHERWKGYGASACDINRGHVDMVSRVRRPKYEPLLASQ